MTGIAARLRIAALVIVAATATGCAAAGATPSAEVRQSPDAGVSTADVALDKLAALTTKGRAPKTGYSRAQFGPRWTDNVDVAGGHNSCDTRNDTLIRWLHNPVFGAKNSKCTTPVISGILEDPYTGKTISFDVNRPSDVQIEHRVSLSDAWQKGAQQWSKARRTQFANDPENLLPVDGRTNQQKNDGDAATWMPPNKKYWCTYIAAQVDVKAKYAVSVTAAERDTMHRILTACTSNKG